MPLSCDFLFCLVTSYLQVKNNVYRHIWCTGLYIFAYTVVSCSLPSNMTSKNNEHHIQGYLVYYSMLQSLCKILLRFRLGSFRSSKPILALRKSTRSAKVVISSQDMNQESIKDRYRFFSFE